MIVILRQVVVRLEVLLIEVQAVALSLEAKLLVPDHSYMKGHVLTTGPLGESGGVALAGGEGGGVGRRCGTTGDSRGAPLRLLVLTSSSSQWMVNMYRAVLMTLM